MLHLLMMCMIAQQILPSYSVLLKTCSILQPWDGLLHNGIGLKESPYMTVPRHLFSTSMRTE